jgi:DNA-directed RNA polymerase subunit M/transcription elongation factor TFIIS
VEPEVAPPPTPETPLDSPYYEDRQVLVIATVWSLSDALQVQRLLDQAGIPFFMGSEKATGVDAVTSNFANGVTVSIMRVGWPWEREALQYYEPANEPDRKPEEEPGDVAVRCPKCHSTEVIFDGQIGEQPTAEEGSPQEYEWTCDSCGYRWKDDGIAKRG